MASTFAPSNNTHHASSFMLNPTHPPFVPKSMNARNYSGNSSYAAYSPPEQQPIRINVIQSGAWRSYILPFAQIKQFPVCHLPEAPPPATR